MLEYQQYRENMMSDSKGKLLKNRTGTVGLPGVKLNHIEAYEIKPSVDVR